MSDIDAANAMVKEHGNLVLEDGARFNFMSATFRRFSFLSVLDCFEGREGYSGRNGIERLLNALSTMETQ